MPARADSPGIELITVAAPAAGAEFNLTAPGDRMLRVLSLSFTLITSAVVANRRVALRADDGTDVYFAAVSSLDHTAGLTVVYSAYAGAPATGTLGSGLSLALPAPGLVLPVGAHLRSSTVLIDAGDAYSEINVLCEFYPSGRGHEWLPGPMAMTREREA
jgi:hypothetical protein